MSISKNMHVTAEEAGQPRARIKAPVAAPPRDAFTQRQLIDAIGDALAMMREEMETQSEARAAALEARLAMLEARMSPDELASRIGAQTRQLMGRLTAESGRNGRHTNH